MTIADVAARAGVSKTAVSFVFNGRRGLSEATTESILRAARDLKWRPDAGARALSLDRPYRVGLVIRRPAADMESGLFEFLDGLGTRLAAGAASMIVRFVSSAEGESEAYAELAGRSQVDIVLLTDLRMSDDRLGSLLRLGLPFVVADRPSAVAADRAGVLQALLHLNGLGHRHVAMIVRDGLFRSDSRAVAFERHARALRLTVSVHPVPDSPLDAAIAVTDRLVRLTEPPTAVVYETSLLAAAALRVAGSANLNVPSDVSVLSLQDDAVARHANPPLTAVRWDHRAWGRVCGSRLLARLAGQAPESAALPRPSLIARESTSRPCSLTRKVFR
ncbi:LacI family DNA-binding transcriptional regulator [Leifsonia sp. NPDC080035]|uniref:LacI family DNA-binding transcriptional regulator n=1 Tax=Leifsonia sp. NPDC080035 TaxID=3143936 RepID=A0AAU7GDM1_9MICO